MAQAITPLADGAQTATRLAAEHTHPAVTPPHQSQWLRWALDQHTMVCTADAQGQITDANDKLCQVSGFAREELLGRHHSVLGSRLQPAHTARQVDDCMAKGQVWKGELCCNAKAGHHFWVEATVLPLPAESGGGDQTLFIFTDVTARKAAEEKLRLQQEQTEAQVQQRTRKLQEALADLHDSHEKHRLMLDESSDPIFVFDPFGRYQYVNRTFGQTLGLSVPQIVGKTIWDIFPGEGGDQRFAVMRRAFEQGSVQTIEVAIPLPAGTRHLITTVKPIRGVSGQVDSVICISKDVTALKQAEAAAQAASRSKSEFLANMSHEIRTPMNGILGLAQIGYRQSAGRSQSQGTFAQILDSGKLLLTILNDVLDFSKIEAGKLDIEFVPLDPRRIIETAVHPFRELAARKSLRLRSVVQAGVPGAMRGDPVRIAQVLLNLLSNAIKFTESGEVELVAALVGPQLRISVRDTGMGMGAELMAQLFAPFQQGDSSTTRRFGGTGLGLTISRQLARLMGGELWVSSEVGQGSQFTLTLPCVPCDEPLPGPPSGRSGGPSGGPVLAGPGTRLAGLRFLVAEDNAVNQMVIQDALLLEGASVQVVANGQLAVDAVAQDPSAFDMVLMDLQMPVMDGLHATRALQRIAPSLAVLGQTAHALPEERLACQHAGMVATVTKPIDHEELVLTILGHTPRAPQARAAGLAQPQVQVQSQGDAAAAAALIDWVQLDRRYGQRPQFVQRLLGLALTNLGPMPELIRHAAAADDWQALARHAHTVKGSCGDLSAPTVQNQAKATEQAARSCNPHATAHAGQLAELTERFLDEVRAGMAADRSDGKR
jgi:PAS domain S-box-containing protein